MSEPVDIDESWRIEADAECLMQAEEIKNDPPRHRRAIEFIKDKHRKEKQLILDHEMLDEVGHGVLSG